MHSMERIKTGRCSVELVVACSCLVAIGMRASGDAKPYPFFEPIQPSRRHQIVVHGGEANQAPADSRPALERCIEDGLEWAEVAVRLTRDGQHVLSHADRVSAGSAQNWAIGERTLSEWKAVDLGSQYSPRYAGESLLSLREAFALAKNRLNLCLDCREVSPEQLAREILEAGMEHQVVVCDEPVLLKRLDAASGGRVALMAHWHPGTDITSWVGSNHLSAVAIEVSKVTADVNRAFQALGVKVQVQNAGSSDTAENWDKAIRAGADWLQTDLATVEGSARAIFPASRCQSVCA